MPVDTQATPDRYTDRDGRRYEVVSRAPADYGKNPDRPDLGRCAFTVERVREVGEEER